MKSGHYIAQPRSLLYLKAGLLLLLVAFGPEGKHSYGQQSQEELSRLEKNYQTLPHDTTKVYKAIQLSRAFNKQALNPEKEFAYAREALLKAQELKDTFLYAEALDNLGLIYRFHEWFALALPLHHQAYELARQASRVPLQALARYANNAGVAARYNQQYSLSIDYYLKALKIAKKEGHLKNQSIAYNGLGLCYASLSQGHEKALEYFTKALATERQANNSLGEAMNLLSIGNYYSRQGNYVKARLYLDTLYQINLQRKDTLGLAHSHQAMANVFFKEQKNPEQAEEHYLRALAYFRIINRKIYVANLMNDLGDFYLSYKQSAKAKAFFKQGLQLAIDLKQLGLQAQSYYGLSLVAEKEGNLQEALAYYKKGKESEDHLELDKQNTQVLGLAHQFDLDQKESQIEQLKQESFLNHKANKAKRILLIVSSSVVVLALLVFLVLAKIKEVRNRTKALFKKKEDELIKAKLERSIAEAEMVAARSQLNPHFLFNSLNAIHLLIKKKEPEKANHYLVTLSRFLRMILELPKSDVIALEKELELINYYLKLESKRFDSDFTYHIDPVAPELQQQVKIPPLLLQPFVENAIWHGLLPSPKKEKTLQIRIRKQEKGVCITISDNGIGRQEVQQIGTPPFNKRKSMGTAITQERIRQYNHTYNCHIALEIEDKYLPDGRREGTDVHIALTNCIHSKKD